ncbi:MAG: hypothetical protein ACPGWS_07990 [Solirubrobacterales bacterium]
MPTETIRPTAHTVDDPTVLTPASSYNGNTADYAQHQQPTVGQVSRLTVRGFPADASPASRTSVILSVHGSWKSADTTYDSFKVYFRKISTDAWTEVLSDQPGGAGWPDQPSQSARTVDITALCGSQPSTDWEVGTQFFNGAALAPTPPSYTVA